MSYRDNVRIGVHIADIHIGVRLLTAEEFKYQLYEKFIKPISEFMFLDFISINGDISHAPLSFNSKLAEVYLWFINSVVKICKEKNASLIIIKGTISHEVDQLDNISFYEKDKNLELHICEEPTIIETKGLKLYCLPDVYIKDKKFEAELYKYEDNYFDYILGHGSVTETQFIKQDSEHAISKNIIYDSKQLVRMCKGPILFGHIHQPLKFRNHIYYINSFTRFSHSEEADKGYMLSAYLPDSGKYKVERVVNDLAFNFRTFKMKYNDFDNYTADDIVKKIDSFVKLNRVDRLCIDIQYLNTEINISKIQMIRNYYNKNEIKPKLKLKGISSKEASILDEAESKIDKSKSYLMDKSIKFEEKAQRFIEEEYKVFIPLYKLEILLMTNDLLTRREDGVNIDGSTNDARAI